MVVELRDALANCRLRLVDVPGVCHDGDASGTREFDNPVDRFPVVGMVVLEWVTELSTEVGACNEDCLHSRKCRDFGRVCQRREGLDAGHEKRFLGNALRVTAELLGRARILAGSGTVPVASNT